MQVEATPRGWGLLVKLNTKKGVYRFRRTLLGNSTAALPGSYNPEEQKSAIIQPLSFRRLLWKVANKWMRGS